MRQVEVHEVVAAAQISWNLPAEGVLREIEMCELSQGGEIREQGSRDAVLGEVHAGDPHPIVTTRDALPITRV